MRNFRHRSVAADPTPFSRREIADTNNARTYSELLGASAGRADDTRF